MKTLKDILCAVNELKIPDILVNTRSSINNNYVEFSELIRKEPSRVVYGVNTYPGHQDQNGLESWNEHNTQLKFLKSHSISIYSEYSEFEARCIGYTKAYSISAGGSLVSLELYDLICKGISDKNFKPNIPKLSSYSCGDVIPASHWACDLLHYGDKNFKLKAGEAISLMNGSFVHLGVSVYLSYRIKRFWSLFVETSKAYVSLIKANPKCFVYWHTAEMSIVSDMLRYISEALQTKDSDIPQDPVSTRSLPQVIECLASASNNFLKEVNYFLFKPSGNPLMLEKQGINGLEKSPHPQGSFMLPSLTSATSSLIEAVLLCSWCSVSRTKYALSGKTSDIPTDGKIQGLDFGFIQWPKFMQSILEEIRDTGARRAFASGGSTSYGIEDLWSFGTLTSDKAIKIIDKAEYILCYEFVITVQCLHRFQAKRIINNTELHEIIISDKIQITEKIQSIINWIDKDSDMPPKRLFYI